MESSLSGGRSRSSRREPPTMGKQLVMFITLTEINNETHYVAKNIKKQKTKQKKTPKKQAKTAPIGFALSV